MHHSVREIAATGLSSLAWAGDDLVDWVGGTRISPAGEVAQFNVGSGWRFDGAVGLGDVAAVFETLGTKGRILRALGEVPEGMLGVEELREIDRSYYHADVYAYPVCIFDLPDGRTAIAHCPHRYDTLEIELLDGTRLTVRDEAGGGVFHSRLAASPGGRWLLSRAWVWQPWNVACVYDVALALAKPLHLSSIGVRLDLGALDTEVDAAALSGDRLIATASADRPMLSVVELPSGKNVHCIPLDAYLGQWIAAWGPDHIVAIEGHPRIVAIADGAVVEAWPDLAIESRYQPSHALVPPKGPHVAVDAVHARFAVAGTDKVTVVSLDPVSDRLGLREAQRSPDEVSGRRSR